MSDMGQYRYLRRNAVEKLARRAMDGRDRTAFKQLWCLVSLAGWLTSRGLRL
jgi:hypothetical protein